MSSLLSGVEERLVSLESYLKNKEQSKLRGQALKNRVKELVLEDRTRRAEIKKRQEFLEERIKKLSPKDRFEKKEIDEEQWNLKEEFIINFENNLIKENLVHVITENWWDSFRKENIPYFHERMKQDFLRRISDFDKYEAKGTFRDIKDLIFKQYEIAKVLIKTQY